MSEQTSSKHAASIADLARQILALCQDVTANRKAHGVAERTLTEAQEIADSGKCLNCGRPYPKDDRIRRGLDSACYTQILRLVDRGEYNDGELVAAGLWLPKTKGGRPKATEREGSAIERYANSKRLANDPEVAANIREAMEDQPPRPTKKKR